jgi:hypothetical protein
MTDAEALIIWLTASPAGRPVEDLGATAIFAAISGTDIAAVMRSRRVRRLTARERDLLRAAGALAGHERRGVLYAGLIPAASTSAVILPRRIPASVRNVLGIAASGAVLPAADEVPLGRALRGLGVRREPVRARLTPGRRDAEGNEQVICSTARLWLAGVPIAIVTERVHSSFLAAFPRPWGSPG